MIAFQDIEEASANGDGKLFWYSVQGLLVSVERLSFLLWPSDPKIPDRGEVLRESLGIGGDSPLKNRNFTDRFLRFDEQLEEWHLDSEQRRFFDSYTEPLDVLAETTASDRFRGYDIDKNALLFHEELHYLDPISTAVEEIHRRAEEEMTKPRFDLDG